MRLVLADRAASEAAIARMARAVAALAALVDPGTGPAPATPTPSLAADLPCRFTVFPEGLHDRKFAAFVVVPPRTKKEHVLDALLTEASVRLRLAMPATHALTRDDARVTDPAALCGADRATVPELWISTAILQTPAAVRDAAAPFSSHPPFDPESSTVRTFNSRVLPPSLATSPPPRRRSASKSRSGRRWR